MCSLFLAPDRLIYEHGIFNFTQSKQLIRQN